MVLDEHGTGAAVSTRAHGVSYRGIDCVSAHVLAPGPVGQRDCGCPGESCGERDCQAGGAAHSCRELLSRWSGHPSPREHVQVVNLEAALFWQEVCETQQRANASPRAEAESAIAGSWEGQTNGLVTCVREYAHVAS